MNEEKFFGESQSVEPKKTLKETVEQMKEVDEKNQKRGGDGTVVLKNLADKKIRVNLSAEKIPEPEENN